MKHMLGNKGTPRGVARSHCCCPYYPFRGTLRCKKFKIYANWTRWKGFSAV